MSNYIDQFMWGYQEHFRISAKRHMQRLAEIIGVSATPTVFLVGIANHPEAPHRVCVEPEKEFHYTQSTFADFQTRYDLARETDPRADMLQSHPIAQQNEDRSLHLRSVRKAILASIEAQDEGIGCETFCSMPVQVGRYEVSVIVQIPTEELTRYPTLQKYERRENPYRSYAIERSLVRSAVRVFLGEAARELYIPDTTFFECNAEDLAREAGRRMMSAAVTLGDVFETLDSDSLYRACNMISSARYEGASSLGDMLIYKRGHLAVQEAMGFADPIELSNHRGIRKLLELAASGQHLLSNGGVLYGLGSLAESYDLASEEVFRIRFIKHHVWELVHGSEVLMVVKYGVPQTPSLPLDYEKLKVDLPRFFPSITSDEIENMCSLVLRACEQTHGTTVVICGSAKQEAERLRGQATLIEPTTVTPELVGIITSIDGGILVDPQGVCYAIGVILDGAASPKGNPSRGGRYNSAVRYTEANPGTMCIVVSVDETVDIVPNLRPQIDRRIVDNALTVLTDLASQKSVDAGDHNVALSKLQAIRFYLTPDDCEAANRLIEAVRTKIDYGDGALIISDVAFRPHPEMNASYYL